MDNRELALAIWLGWLAILLLVIPQTRAGVAGVARSAAHWKIWLVFLTAVVYISGFAVAVDRFGWWDWTSTKTTAFWFCGTAVSLLFGISDRNRSNYLRRVIVRSFSLGVLLESFVNLYVFGLWLELALVPVSCTLALLSAAGGARPQFRAVKHLADWGLAIVGTILLVHVTLRLVSGPPEFTLSDVAWSLALPMLLTVFVVPLLYVLALTMTYELAFLHIDFASVDRRARARAKFVLLGALNLRLEDVERFAGHWPARLAQASSVKDAWLVMKQFRTSERSGA